MQPERTSVADLLIPSELEEFAVLGGGPSIEETDIDAPDFPILDPAARYGLAGGIVERIEPHSESDPVALLISILAAFGNVIGRHAFYQVERDRHCANIFAVLVGTSSTARKGTSWGHVRHLFSGVDDVWASKCQKSGLGSGEGVINAIRDRSEKDNANDAGIDDKRLFVIEAEFASILRVSGRESSILSVILRNAWDSDKLINLVKNSPLQATGAHISVIGHITDGELRRLLNPTEVSNGFANRFLWAHVRRSKLLPGGGNIESVDFNLITSQLREAVDWAHSIERMRWESTARKAWDRAYEELTTGRPGMFGSVTSRAEAQTCRLALIYALLDRSPEIRVVHLKAALAVWAYCEASARYIFGDKLGDLNADAILTALREIKPKGMTRTEISVSMFQRNKTSAEINTALMLLMRQELVRMEKIPTEKGRPAHVFYAV